MNENEFDLVVIGGGPGGYTTAISGSQNGLKTALVERGSLGGTCLNRGCVPTKTLLHDTRLLPVLQSSHFLTGEMKVSLENINGRKNTVVEGSRAWLENLLVGNGVTTYLGHAAFTGPKSIEIKQSESRTVTLQAERIVLATGAAEQYPGGLTPDGQSVWSTDDALQIDGPPQTVAVVGGGARGVELAQVYHNLGTRVALFEKEKRLLPRFDRGLTGRYKNFLKNRNIKVLTRTTVISARTGNDGRAVIEYEDKTGRQSAEVDKVILALPRRPDFSSLNIEPSGLSLVNGSIECGPDMETGVPGIYIVGDAAGPPFWAHKAIAQGLAVVRHITGREGNGQPELIPACVYGDPEIGVVGLTENQVKESGLSYKLGEFHFIGNGRAGTMNDGQGLVRLLSNSKSNRILGVHILGPGATELVSLAAMAMENDLGLDEIKRTVFAHPTLAESFFEAALATDGQAIHMLEEG